MKTLYRSLLFLFPVLFPSCDEKEITSRGYPRLRTLDVSNVNESGATLKAEITYRGNFEILQYGFVWSEEVAPTIHNSERVIFLGNIQAVRFAATISTALVPNREYYVRPFVQTEDYLVYGKNVQFISRGSNPPVITDFFPKTGFGTHGEIIGGDIHTLIVKVPSMASGPTNIHLFTQNLGTLGTPFEVK